jgi:hypothetical protein
MLAFCGAAGCHFRVLGEVRLFFQYLTQTLIIIPRGGPDTKRKKVKKDALGGSIVYYAKTS